MPVYSISKLPIKNSERPPNRIYNHGNHYARDQNFFCQKKRRSRLDITYIWPKVSFSYMINCPQNEMNLPPSSVMTTTMISEVLILAGLTIRYFTKKNFLAIIRFHGKFFLEQYFKFTEKICNLPPSSVMTTTVVGGPKPAGLTICNETRY